MAKILGNLSPEDDGLHALGPEPNFNESMYFNFFDPSRGLGGFVRLGNRANEGRAEMTVCVFLPDRRVLFAFKRASIDHNDAFDAGGLRLDVVEPTQRLRTRYTGGVIELADPVALADPSRAFRDSPKRRLNLDLTHEAVGPMYGKANDPSEAGRDPEKQFAKAHYEQHMRVSGTLDYGDGEIALGGFGLRDHSWGPRYWQAIDRYEWLTLNFGPDLGAMVSRVQVAGAPLRQGGVIVRGDDVDNIVGIEIDAEYEENGLYHRSLIARIETKSGASHEISGTVRGFIPLRNRRDGRMTHIGEGMTEWRWGDRTGYGLSEFLRQV
ncbi:MAG: hypothetical protein AAF430_17705 [Myxococcota bacterium]